MIVILQTEIKIRIRWNIRNIKAYIKHITKNQKEEQQL